MAPTSHNMYVPYVTRIEYALLDVGQEAYLTLMNDEGVPKEDLKVDDVEVEIFIQLLN